MKLTIPMRTYSESNRREHWAVKARRVKEQRGLVAMCYRGCITSTTRQIIFFHVHKPAKLTITLTRLGKKLMDDDNLARSFKAIRDELSQQLGVDDGDKRLRWRYKQRLTKSNYAVEIEIEPK
jgi:hypothetical protein